MDISMRCHRNTFWVHVSAAAVAFGVILPAFVIIALHLDDTPKAKINHFISQCISDF